MLAELYKKLRSTEIKTQIAVLKFQSAHQCALPAQCPRFEPEWIQVVVIFHIVISS